MVKKGDCEFHSLLFIIPLSTLLINIAKKKKGFERSIKSFLYVYLHCKEKPTISLLRKKHKMHRRLIHLFPSHPSNLHYKRNNIFPFP